MKIFTSFVSEQIWYQNSEIFFLLNLSFPNHLRVNGSSDLKVFKQTVLIIHWKVTYVLDKTSSQNISL